MKLCSPSARQGVPAGRLSEAVGVRCAGGGKGAQGERLAAKLNVQRGMLRGAEPVDHGDADTGPAPFGLLLSGLGACTAITLRMYAERRSWPLAGVNVELTYVVVDRNTSWIHRLITLHGVDEDQRAKLAEIAEKTPVTRVVRAGTEIRTTTRAA